MKRCWQTAGQALGTPRGCLAGSNSLNHLWLIMACSAPQSTLPREQGGADPPPWGMSPRSRQRPGEYFPFGAMAGGAAWVAARRGLCLQGGVALLPWFVSFR